MDICVLSDGFPPWEDGGAQKVAAQVARGYRQRGHTVSVVTTVTSRDDAGQWSVDGVTIYRLSTPRPKRLLPYLRTHNPFVSRDVGRALDRIDPDVVHAHNVHWLSNASLRAAASRDVPTVKTFHDAGTVSYGELTHLVDEVPMPEEDGLARDRPPTEPLPERAYRIDPWRQLRDEGFRYNPLRNRMNRRAIDRHVSVGVAVSDALRRALRANGVPCHEVIHNGVSTETRARAPRPTPGDGHSRFRRAHALGDAPFVLFGGRTGYNKGGAHLAAAFAEVCASIDAEREVRLVVTGDDGYVRRMREIADPYGEQIVATGWIPRTALFDALASATVVATPSVHLDPFPTLNIEAFAEGTPVVTSRFGGASELVDHGEDGFVVDPRDVGALAEALRTYLDDPERARDHGNAGQEKVFERYTVDRQVEAYLDVIERARGSA